MSFKIILIISLLCLSNQFFGKDSSVIQLNKNNFVKKVIKSNNIWLILFYAPWCGHCKEFHPEFEKLAKSTKGLFKLGAVNCENDRELAERYKIEGFPTMLFFGDDKNKVEEYEGDREAAKIIDFLFEKTKKITNNKLKKLKDIKTDL